MKIDFPLVTEQIKKEGVKSKTYSDSIKSIKHGDQAAFQETKAKNRHGKDTAKSMGIFGLEI